MASSTTDFTASSDKTLRCIQENCTSDVSDHDNRCELGRHRLRNEGGTGFRREGVSFSFNSL